MEHDALIESYLTLAFQIERQVPGFVDAYFGPPARRAAIADAADRPAAALLADAKALSEQLGASALPEPRNAYLAAQARAMVALCRKLAGEPLSFTEEVRLCFDIEPAHTSEAQFEAAIADLDRLLPGDGPINQRLSEWRRRFVIAPAVAHQLIEERIVPEVRRRTEALIPLPPGEAVEFRLVSSQPWSGYNWYLGQARSRVEINTDLPLYANSLTDLVCHEVYPGHHTEHALKENGLYRERGYGEYAVQLVLTPEAVISEGIATLAATIIFADDELIAWQQATLYPAAGITGDPERERAMLQAHRVLRGVSANAALLLHEQGGSREEAVAYLMRYGLRSESETRQQLAFLTNPLWRSYIFTYHAGRDLLATWLDQGDRLTRFRRLLIAPVTPSLVRSWLSNGA